MIEADRGPLVLLVAGFALGAIPSGMDILNLVAIDARCADPLVAFANMARGARDVAMRSLQRELGLVMVERLHATPCGFAMTIVARFAQTPLMRIVRLMTVEAATRGVAELYILCVTAVALHRLVSGPKPEIRECMIECLAIEQDDVGISPFVVAVTMRALLFRRIRLTPVKPVGQLTVGGSFFMACQA
jgi:hypothetical protein